MNRQNHAIARRRAPSGRNQLALACLIGCILWLGGCGKENASSAVIRELTVNYRTNPLALDDHPAFSWKMEDDAQGQKQTAYQLLVAKSRQQLEKGKYVWDSGKVESEEAVAVPYAGQELQAETRYYWQVRVWDKEGKQSESQEEAFFETGALWQDWPKAEWICLPEQEIQESRAAAYTVEYDMRMEEPAYSGFVWGANERDRGAYYVCAVDAAGDNFSLAILEHQGEKILCEQRYDLSGYGFGREAFFGRTHRLSLKIEDRNLEIELDGIHIDDYLLSEVRDIGSVGFWVTRGAYYAYYDNLIIKKDTGEALYEEGFARQDEHIFSPYYIKIEDGWLEASSGYLFTPGGEEAAPMLYQRFTVEKEVAGARLYASALGIYELYLNGEKVGDEYFSPGQSFYSKEVYYRAYDVTEYLRQGDNAIGVMLGSGRYDMVNSTWGEQLAFLGKLVLTYTDGSRACLVSDGSWLGYGDGAVRSEDMYGGEFYDANKEVEGWAKADMDQEGWEAVSLYEAGGIELVASDSEPVRCIQEISPVSVSEPVEGTYVYDFGQNMNGFCRIKVTGQAGQILILRYAEALNEENMSGRDDEVGTVWTQNLYTADNTDYYVLKGGEEEVYEPAFVCRGFRYVQISGLTRALTGDEITALALSSDLERAGYFDCSDEGINQLYRSIYWSQLSNYVDIPTDCPQRDERFGWSGDAQAFAPTAAYNSHIYQFMRQYVTALRLGQNEDGSYPQIAPVTMTEGGGNGWSDAGIILVWELYQQYGDREIIRENLEAMCRYMDYLVETSEGFIRTDEGYSDFNAVSGLETQMCNTAQCAYVADLLAKMCGIQGEAKLEEKYRGIHEQYKKAWQENFLNEDGTIGNWQQSAYTLGLAFDLYPEELKEKGAEYLNISIAAWDYHISTGYIATPHLLQILCDYGYTDTAYRLLQQETYPSWQYMFSHGSTTITEGWDTYVENEDGAYTISGSLNHAALGSVGKWLYEDLLGIKRDEGSPGFQHFYLEPMPGGGLSYASGSYESMYGTIVSEWKIQGEEILFRFVIPPNSSATLSLPDPGFRDIELEAGEYEFRIACQ